MGADTKALRTRIKSVDSTLHLTKAMGLVASSKIRRANNAMHRSGQYAQAVEEAIDTLTSSPECRRSPYMRQAEESPRTEIIVIAGDRGLAGGYNANVFRLAREYDAKFIPIGKRACDRYGGEFYSSEAFTSQQAGDMCAKLCERFAAEEYDRLGIIYTKYNSMLSQEAALKWVLPLRKGESKTSGGMIFEPDEVTILNSAVNIYVTGMLISAVRESFASEVAARRMAMDSAGKNAQTMIDDLQLAYNRARQGAITQEITEIVAGSGE